MQIKSPLATVFCAAFLAFFSTFTLADIELIDYQQVGSDRVSRFEFDYHYKVNVVNSGDVGQANISGSLTSNSASIMVVDGDFAFDNMAAGETAESSDTFIIRVNRRVRFDPSQLVFQFSSEDVIGTDNDGDGFTVEDGDCNDANPNINPAADDIPNNGIDEDCDGQDTIIAPDFTVQINSPASLSTVGVSPVLVEGSVTGENVVLTLNGIEIDASSGEFSADVALQEGLNTIVARGTRAEQQVTDSISISLDQTPPFVTVESHTNGQTVYSDSITVTGLINDIVRGTIEQEQASVMVNGRSAAIANRSYAAMDIPLLEGQNSITVTGSDQVGNVNSISFSVIYAVTLGRSLEINGGQNQITQINQPLAEPLSVKVLDDNGQPVVGEAVIFRVVQGSGLVAPDTASEGRAVVVDSDSLGNAVTSFKLGARVGVANHKVRAQVVGYQEEIIFNASAIGTVGNKISVNSGNNQRGAVGQVLPQPLVAVVTDSGANVVQGANVEFSVTRGEGLFPNGEKVYVAQTDSDGRATAELTLGYLVGLDVQRVTAKLLGVNSNLTAGFVASGFNPGVPGNTRISGVVLDNQDNPIPSVTLRIEGSNRQAQSDDQGQFIITEAPVGPVHLIADGSTASVPGEFPSLSYNLVTVSGANNPLSAPIYMVKLDTDNAVTVGAQDVDLVLDAYPGFKLEVAANSVTFPDGSKQGLLSVTQVNANKVPMAPPNGMQPQFIVTIQPTNTRFDPPARLTLPNVDGFPVGEQVEMYSYDHDLEEFVSIGLGTVADDGTTVQSNPGIGVIKAGWHCGSQPGGQGCAHNCPVCQDCDGDCNCVPADGDPSVQDQNVEGDCQSPECQGGAAVSVNDDSDIPQDQDVEGDCKIPGCENGSPMDKDDDTDLPPDENCKTCNTGMVENVPDGSNPIDTAKCCFEGAELEKKQEFAELMAKCPNKTQDTTRLHEIDGCSNSPDNLESWDNLTFRNYNLYVTNPIWGTVLGQTANTNQTLPCNIHDICYQSCGSSQLSCDNALGTGITASCDIGYPFPCALADQTQCTEYTDEYNACRGIGPIYRDGVQNLGGGAFRERQEQYCDCC